MRDTAADGQRTLRVGYWITAAATVGLAVVLTKMGEDLKTPEAPRKVVSLELAATVQRANAILKSWNGKVLDGETALDLAKRSIVVDFPFIVAYSTALGGGCWWAAGILRRRGFPGGNLVRRLAWLQPVAGVLDIVENVGMLEEMDRFGRSHAPEWLPRVVAASAGTKFVLLGLGIVAIMGGLVLRWWPARRTP